MEHDIASSGVATLVWLLIAIMVVAVVSKYIRLPYTVALVIAGFIIALTPVHLVIDLTPDLILFIFLPALLFEAGYNLHFEEVRDNLRPIVLLAVPGVILTAVGLAVITHYATGVSWETAFLFGAIMSATDPVSVLAIFRQVGAPRRLSVILEGESLFNDGTAIVLFRIMLAIVISHAIGNVVVTIEQFFLVVLGGLALGALIGYVASLLLSRVNDYLVESAATLVVAYGTYLLGERMGVSGVIAVVVAALIVGSYGRLTAMSPTTRIAVSSTWEFFGFLANSFIFLLIGLEINISALGQYWPPTVLAIAAVLLVRAIVVLISSQVLHYIHRPVPPSWRVVLVWGGLRGSVALAMALSLPLTLGPRQPFPDRTLLQVMTFGVILFSLLVQGLTMQPLIRRLGLMRAAEGAQEAFEVIGVRRAMSSAALTEVSNMARAGQISDDLADEIRQSYASQIDDLNRAMQNLHMEADDLRREHVRSIRRRLLQVEKAVVRERHVAGAISEETMRALLAELDEQLHALDAREVTLVPETPAEAS